MSWMGEGHLKEVVEAAGFEVREPSSFDNQLTKFPEARK